MPGTSVESRPNEVREPDYSQHDHRGVSVAFAEHDLLQVLIEDALLRLRNLYDDHERFFCPETISTIACSPSKQIVGKRDRISDVQLANYESSVEDWFFKQCHDAKWRHYPQRKIGRSHSLVEE